MIEKTIPELEISDILDKTTFVITGKGVADLHVGTRLLVLAVGGKVKGTNAPLVISKITLEVTSNASAYVIARPPLVEVEANPWIGIIQTSRKVKQRLSADVDENSLSGNPGQAPVKPGDVVICEQDFSAYVKSKTEAI